MDIATMIDTVFLIILVAACFVFAMRASIPTKPKEPEAQLVPAATDLDTHKDLVYARIVHVLGKAAWHREQLESILVEMKDIHRIKEATWEDERMTDVIYAGEDYWELLDQMVAEEEDEDE